MAEEIEQFDDAMVAMAGSQNVRDSLAGQMATLQANAVSGDANRLKLLILNHVAGLLPDRTLNPPIQPTDAKDDCRGLNHPQLAALVIPLEHSTIAGLLDGTLRVTSGSLPAFLYPPGTIYNRRNLKMQSFRGPLWILVYKAIFTGPSSATGAEYNEPKTKKTRAQCMGLSKVTPASIAYAVLHTHFALSSAKEWRVANTDTFKKDQFFANIVLILSQQGKWRDGVFAWANESIFGHCDGARSQTQASFDGPTDIDLFLAEDSDAGDEGDTEEQSGGAGESIGESARDEDFSTTSSGLSRPREEEESEEEEVARPSKRTRDFGPAETPVTEPFGPIEQEANYDADISDKDHSEPDPGRRWFNTCVADKYTPARRDAERLKFVRGRRCKGFVLVKGDSVDNDGTVINQKRNRNDEEYAHDIMRGYDADDEDDGVFD
ncbi:hypothetical protein AGABI2DRAFT_113965 [Agaricus bisporus var. bisporus H97]|uniref:hypothetical protein n=1 Tax=Agaricus bisporus var. bisporus (strain H97 / ATCC MYA-4626 / FGSC 10389) TaxID=936046 RepID=UPI00029F6E5C|nr:hypothetical protein AGABI2DRAFT_113965 [Agaricus bisporus var. bisporus H97]EKV51227.1 hypothetical protein AGABI2DRAFT_113965 [Agaricus bisporus var. bisporus H97]